MRGVPRTGALRGTGFTVTAIAAALAMAAGGCRRSAQPRTSVTGEVREPACDADRGEVRFVPLAADAAQGPTTVAIAAGRFQVRTGGGLMPGEYRVEATAKRGTGRRHVVPTVADEVEVEILEPTSDPAYAGAASPLRFRAAASGAATFDIDVPAAAPAPAAR